MDETENNVKTQCTRIGPFKNIRNDAISEQGQKHVHSFWIASRNFGRTYARRSATRREFEPAHRSHIDSGSWSLCGSPRSTFRRIRRSL